MLIRKASQILSVLVLFLTMPLALAVNILDINTARVPVENTSVHAMQRALPIALSQVLIKVSGNPSVNTVPQVQEALHSAQGMLQSYNYVYREIEGGQRQLLLKAIFDIKAVRALLQQANQGVWSANRPLLLAWIKVNGDQYDNQILSANNSDRVEKTIQQTASMRGVPIIFPQMDLNDQAFINTNPNLPFDDNKLMSAAARYHVKVVLAGALNKVDSGWESNWVLMVDGTPFSWQVTGNTPSEIVTQAMDSAANLMANRWAVVENSNLTSTVRLEVMGVSNIEDYAKATHVLRSIPLVNSVEVQEVNEGNVIMAVQAAGGEQALSDAMQNNGQFIAVPAPSAQDNQRADLYYRWRSQVPTP